MSQTQQNQTLWETPLRRTARTRKRTPEAWHAECLSGEREDLEVLVRALEFDQGYTEGLAEGFRVGVNSIALALRSTEEKAGDTTEPPLASTAD